MLIALQTDRVDRSGRDRGYVLRLRRSTSACNCARRVNCKSMSRRSWARSARSCSITARSRRFVRRSRASASLSDVTVVAGMAGSAENTPDRSHAQLGRDLLILDADRAYDPAAVKARATRFTSDPDTPAPQLACPTCGRALLYRQTVYGGVIPPERWDYLECRTCGPFQFRHRTSQLRRSVDV
jgi:hypothetical protein